MNQLEIDRLATVEDYKTVFSTEPGKRVLWDLMRRGKVLRGTFAGDANSLIFFEGERNLVLWILDQVDMDVKALRQVMEENTRERRR